MSCCVQFFHLQSSNFLLKVFLKERSSGLNPDFKTACFNDWLLSMIFGYGLSSLMSGLLNLFVGKFIDFFLLIHKNHFQDDFPAKFRKTWLSQFFPVISPAKSFWRFYVWKRALHGITAKTLKIKKNFLFKNHPYSVFIPF